MDHGVPHPDAAGRGGARAGGTRLGAGRAGSVSRRRVFGRVGRFASDSNRHVLRQRLVFLQAGCRHREADRSDAGDDRGIRDARADGPGDGARLRSRLSRRLVPGVLAGLAHSGRGRGRHRVRRALHGRAVSAGLPRPGRRVHVHLLRRGGRGGNALRPHRPCGLAGVGGVDSRGLLGDGYSRRQQLAGHPDGPGDRQAHAGRAAGRPRHPAAVFVPRGRVVRGARGGVAGRRHGAVRAAAVGQRAAGVQPGPDRHGRGRGRRAQSCARWHGAAASAVRTVVGGRFGLGVNVDSVFGGSMTWPDGGGAGRAARPGGGLSGGGAMPEWLSRRAQLTPDAPALFFQGRRWTFAELEAAAGAAALRLWAVLDAGGTEPAGKAPGHGGAAGGEGTGTGGGAAAGAGTGAGTGAGPGTGAGTGGGARAGAGVSAGPRVAVLLPNTDAFVVAVHAIAKARAVLVPLNTRLTPRAGAGRGPGAGGVVLSPARPRAEAAADVRRAVAAPGGAGGLRLLDVSGLLAPGSRGADGAGAGAGAAAGLRTRIFLDDVHSIVYTSGTTGRPKGA